MIKENQRLFLKSLSISPQIFSTIDPTLEKDIIDLIKMEYCEMEDHMTIKITNDGRQLLYELSKLQMNGPLTMKVENASNITKDEFETAHDIVMRYNEQQDNTVECVATYEGKLDYIMRIPKDQVSQITAMTLEMGTRHFLVKSISDPTDLKLLKVVINGKNVKLK